MLVGFGGSEAGVKGVASGDWYSNVAQAPASEGRLGVKALIKAIRTGKSSGTINPVASLADGGIITKQNSKQFVPEWPG